MIKLRETNPNNWTVVEGHVEIGKALDKKIKTVDVVFINSKNEQTRGVLDLETLRVTLCGECPASGWTKQAIYGELSGICSNVQCPLKKLHRS